MLSKLKFVQGAVARKDFVPALTHFVIEDSTVRGYNGMLALCSPIPFDITCRPKADPLIKAIANCTETVSLSLTPAGRLSIKSGKFKAFIDCIEGESSYLHPIGEPLEIDGVALLQALKTIAPFIGNDASRPWSNGILLLGQSAFATNNVMLVEYWTGTTMPTPINIPRAAIKEMLRIDEPPISAQLADNAITFHYTGDRWLRTQLFETKWPDLRRVLDKASNPVALDATLFEAIKTVKPFIDKMGRILFKGGRIATHEEETEGASYEIEGFDHSGVYQIDMLGLLEGAAQTIDWSTYPSPCMFFGERLRGAIIGMRA